jgi:hypothetical protein
MVVENLEARGLRGKRFQYRTRVAEVHDYNAATCKSCRGRKPMLDGNELSGWKPFPQSPGGAETIGTLGMV